MMVFSRSIHRAVPMAAAIGIGLTLAAWAAPATAQQQGAPPAEQSTRKACAADFQKFCSGTRPGEGRIIACLRQNTDKLSPGCQQAMAMTTAHPAPAAK